MKTQEQICTGCSFYQLCMSRIDRRSKKQLKQLLRLDGPRQSALPVIKIAHKVCKEIMLTIGTRAPESGGILLGPSGTTDVTDFYFDEHANCTGSTYTPYTKTLRQKMKEVWLPAGIDMKGFVHSHPGSFDRLSAGDIAYIKRFMQKNKDDEMFVAPIVIPPEFRLRPYVVLRDNLNVAREARFVYF